MSQSSTGTAASTAPPGLEPRPHGALDLLAEHLLVAPAVLDPTHPDAHGVRTTMREPFAFDARPLRAR